MYCIICREINLKVVLSVVAFPVQTGSQNYAHKEYNNIFFHGRDGIIKMDCNELQENV